MFTSILLGAACRVALCRSLITHRCLRHRRTPLRHQRILRMKPGPPSTISCTSAKVTGASHDVSLRSRGPLRHEHAIRSRPEKIIWYASEGPPLDAVPVAPTLAEVGDVYVHKSEGDVQVWLRIENGRWLPVSERHPHPRLKDYVLRLLDNGDPRWVTKDTFRTYLGRRKKQSSS